MKTVKSAKVTSHKSAKGAKPKGAKVEAKPQGSAKLVTVIIGGIDCGKVSRDGWVIPPTFHRDGVTTTIRGDITTPEAVTREIVRHYSAQGSEIDRAYAPPKPAKG